MTKRVKFLGAGGRIRVQIDLLRKYDKPELDRLVELANLPDSSLPRFAKRFPDYAKGFSVPYARTLLKEVWRSGDEASVAATKILFPAWMAEMIARAMEKSAEVGADKPLTAEERLSLFPIRADWRRGMLTLIGQSGFQRDFYALLKCSERAKICQWPECNTPYFIVPPNNRTSARYCSDKCREDALLAAKRNWWKENKAPVGKGKK